MRLIRFVENWNEGIAERFPFDPTHLYDFQLGLEQSLVKQYGSAHVSTRDAIGVSQLGKPGCYLSLLKLGLIDGDGDTSFRQKLIFQFGDYFEELLIFLLQSQGFEVTRQQEEVDFLGVKGHIDGVVNDTTIIEVKTMSGYIFDKFVAGSMEHSAYYTQLGIYSHMLDLPAVWLVLNKQTFELGLLNLDRQESFYIERAKFVVNALSQIKKWSDIGKFFDPPDPEWDKRKKRLKIPFDMQHIPLKYLKRWYKTDDGLYIR